MGEGKFVFTPIVSSNTNQRSYCFKVRYCDPVDLRSIKQELIDILRGKDFDVVDEEGWHE